MEADGVAAIDIVSGSQETPEWASPPYYMPEGSNTDITSAIKKSGSKNTNLGCGQNYESIVS